MNRQNIASLQNAIQAARSAAQSAASEQGTSVDACDVSDIEEIIEPAISELERPLPNVQTLATYLNSLARSLRSQETARSAVVQLDAAMREAGVPTTWEH